MTTDLVSIITPCFNSASFLTETIESVLAQTVSDWEMIVVDDCSTDASKTIASSYAEKDARIKLISLDQNSGVSHARNTALRHASGRYMAFLDSDDLWLPSKLEKQLEFMKTNELALSYASYQLIDHNNKHAGEFVTRPVLTYTDLLKTCSIGCSTAIYDAQILGKVYFPDIDKQEDYALWLEILQQIKQTRGILEPLGSYRMHRASRSHNKLVSACHQWKVYRRFAKLGRLKSLFYFCHYAYHGVMKYRR